jgi:hypothetical protein
LTRNVAGARERLEEREPVARGAVADAVALFVAVGAGPPDQLGPGEQQLLVEILPGSGEDSRSARTGTNCRPRTGWRGRAADPSPRSRRCGSLAAAATHDLIANALVVERLLHS